jgi:flavin-dependent dehydrogenase
MSEFGSFSPLPSGGEGAGVWGLSHPLLYPLTPDPSPPQGRGEVCPATLRLADATHTRWDVVVIGAGPSGTLAAYELARRGIQVLLVDRAAFPRWKVCGCCLNSKALATLHAVGLGGITEHLGAVPLRDLRLASAGKEARLPLAGGVVLSREAFDAALVRAAIAAGAAFLPQTRATLGVVLSEGRVVVLHQDAALVTVLAKVVLVADGLGGSLLARAGMASAHAVAGARIGAGVVVGAASPFFQHGTIYMACGEGGYVGLVRREDGRLNLAAALDAASVRAEGGPGRVAARLLAEAGWPLPANIAAAAWKGTPALTRQAPHVAAERVLVLGDAAGYVEPFTGEGLAWALATGVAVAPFAARAADHWHLALARAWQCRYTQIVGRRALCRALAALLRRPALVRALIRLLARTPAVARPILCSLGQGTRCPPAFPLGSHA